MVFSTRYVLQKYTGRASRFACPNCRDKFSFTRYIDTEGEFVFPESVGRCDREAKCGYNYTPYQFFKRDGQTNPIVPAKETKPEPEASFIDAKYVELVEGESNFTQYLWGLFGDVVANKMMDMYKLGASKAWEGSTVFWQISKLGVHAGKIMLYKTNGKREKEGGEKINWVHKRLKLPEFNLKQTLFGLHLIYGNTEKVNIVESESTAIFMAATNLAAGANSGLWLASGGSNGARWYSQEIFMQLGKEREIVIHPDKGKFHEWSARIEAHKANGYKVYMNDFVEKNGKQDNDDYRDILKQPIKPTHPHTNNPPTIEVTLPITCSDALQLITSNGYTNKEALSIMDKWIIDGFVKIIGELLVENNK